MIQDEKVVSDWQAACSIGDMDDEELLEVKVDNQRILLVRTDDSLVACQAVCPHMDEPLELGFCDGKTLTCSKHLWQWDMRTGDAMGPAEEDITIAPVRIENDIVYVDMALLKE
ncbi:Rieske 2Fe-2S domain-containing protein [Pusillimonas sp. T7-7]|uniref:Rieske (2Fe-2S) protein n=1 Tax=Pusillimonas sp. (strain T7-7) TaxID=1007105 RepID=UPI00059FAE14|nr:Rieske 2Fe-2S domain-containing protein [Pusillimonas sp. T7-7]